MDDAALPPAQQIDPPRPARPVRTPRQIGGRGKAFAVEAQKDIARLEPAAGGIAADPGYDDALGGQR